MHDPRAPKSLATYEMSDAFRIRENPGAAEITLHVITKNIDRFKADRQLSAAWLGMTVPNLIEKAKV